MTADQKTRLPWIADELAALDATGLRRSKSETRRLPGGRIERGGRVLFDFASNDYLGLTCEPRLAAAARAALDECGVGSGASALITGRTRWHAELERALAEFEGEEDAILFPTGYAANVGTLTALLGEGDVAFCDRLNHASLVDGCRLSGAALKVYRFDQLDKLERHLAAAAGYRRRWVVTDGVFGMDGVVAPLAELCDIAERYDASVIVDEAHGTGVLGNLGRGACELAGVEDRIAVRIGTLSKAIGAIGGFVAGDAALIEHLWNHARTQMFSTALPPAACAAAIEGARMIRQYAGRSTRVGARAIRLRDQLRDGGIEALGWFGVPIVPVVLGESERAVAAGLELERRAFVVGVIRPPTVPRGTARLRVSLSAVHTTGAVDELADHLIEVCRP
jgi:8-amino-7-oxononanoate synthase